MNQPIVIIFASMVVGFVALIGLNWLINKLDVWLMQRDAPVALKRRLPMVRRLEDDVVEVIEFGNTKWDAIPGLILWGYLITTILVLLPLVTQAQDPDTLSTAMTYIIGLYGLLLLIALWIRSRFTYYQIGLTSAKIRKQIRMFGISGKVISYHLKSPVEAQTDCQPRKADLKDARLRYATCWISKSGRSKFIIIHKNAEEAEQFRTKLIEHGCPVAEQSEDDEI